MKIALIGYGKMGHEIERIAVANQFRGTTALNVGKEVKSTILEFQVVRASDIVKNKLNMKEDYFVYDIYRVRYIDGRPEVMEKMYMPIDLIPRTFDHPVLVLPFHQRAAIFIIIVFAPTFPIFRFFQFLLIILLQEI